MAQASFQLTPTRWILAVGWIGFALGFFGPMLITPEANQGPMLGIFISGPLGVLLGAACALGSWALKLSQDRQLKLFIAVVMFGTLGILIPLLRYHH